MSDNLRFFSSASPESSHGHGPTQNGYGPEFAGAWMEPGDYSDYGPEDYAARAEEELQRLISTDGPTTSWLYSDNDSDTPQTDAQVVTTGSAPIQREMTVGSANDPLEEEADAVAERVMRNPRDYYLDPRVSSFQPYQIGGRGEQVVARLARAAQEEETAQLKAKTPEISRMPEQDEEMQQAPAISRMGEQDEEMQASSLQRNLAGMDEDAKETLGYTHAFEKSDEEEDMGTTTSMYMQREGAASPEGGTVSNDVAQKIDGVRNSGGQPMSASERDFFEPRFQRDFSEVRVHTGPEAADAAQDVNAKAFTIGRDIVFGEGQHRPDTNDGKRLMAHELTHTVQQGAAGLQRDILQRETEKKKLSEQEVEARNILKDMVKYRLGSAAGSFGDAADSVEKERKSDIEKRDAWMNLFIDLALLISATKLAGRAMQSLNAWEDLPKSLYDPAIGIMKNESTIVNSLRIIGKYSIDRNRGELMKMTSMDSEGTAGLDAHSEFLLYLKSAHRKYLMTIADAVINDKFSVEQLVALKVAYDQPLELVDLYKQDVFDLLIKYDEQVEAIEYTSPTVYGGLYPEMTRPVSIALGVNFHPALVGWDGTTYVFIRWIDKTFLPFAMEQAARVIPGAKYGRLPLVLSERLKVPEKSAAEFKSKL